MAETLYLRKTASGFIVDQGSIEKADVMPVGGFYKAVLTVPRAINDDNPTEEQRRIAQNRLYFMWLTDMESTTVNRYAGNTQAWWHDFFKRVLLTRIYERDCQEYAEMIHAVRQVRTSGLESEARTMWKFIVRETSTTRASVAQFREYLNRIQNFCNSNGIWLRTDEGLRRLALEYYEKNQPIEERNER